MTRDRSVKVISEQCRGAVDNKVIRVQPSWRNAVAAEGKKDSEYVALDNLSSDGEPQHSPSEAAFLPQTLRQSFGALCKWKIGSERGRAFYTDQRHYDL